MNNRNFYKKLAHHVREDGDVRLYTALSGEHAGQKALYAGNTTLVQNEALYDFWQSAASDSQLADAPCTAKINGTEVLAENLVRRPRLVICGGGHISLSLSQIGVMLDFEVTVIDDREEFANRERFPTVQNVICADYEKAFAQLDSNSNTYYVIVTRGHSADRECLQAALHCPHAYIGMIGSKPKVAVVMKQMKEDGYSEEQLAQVYAPIGLKIGAQTPAEIAVCIAAELIQVRRSGFAEGCMEDSMLDCLDNISYPVVMATIITKKGSAPRSTGAKMLLDAQGKILSGSIGGGAGEGKVCAMAGDVIENGKPQICTCNMTNTDAKQAGMVCGGTITVLMEPIVFEQ
ncbi:XdhC/CoxI family protein [Hydrogenoanaerobacterium sp.]|uniref:XdhC/CoxI family protein n=1 Tax=Hydrogenoanaerobacterium sp. TaxID=2953763 RepID=UPI0028A2D33D|nr:XdhC/CoxI family protein [Hydrogenoanaerobacterium sp.]